MIGPTRPNRISAALLLGGWLAFLGAQSLVLAKDLSGGWGPLVTKELWGGFSLAFGLLAAFGYALAVRSGPRPRRSHPAYSRLLEILGSLCLGAGFLVHAASRDVHDLKEWAAFCFVRNVLLFGGGALLWTSWERRRGGQAAGPLSAACGMALLLAIPFGVPAGIWWLLRVRREEEGASAT